MVCEKFLEKARRTASHSLIKPYKVGCVIAQGSRVVSVGRNRGFHNERRYKDLHSIHAEMDAILKSNPRISLEGATIYVVVLTQSRKDGCSRPCEHCQVWLRRHKIGQVVWSDRGTIRVEKVK